MDCRNRRFGRAIAIGRNWIAAAAPMVVLLGFGHRLLGGTIRDDVSDSLYTALAAQPQYAAVGNLAGLGGTLISSRWVLTAAHAATSNGTFTLGNTTYNAVQAIINPEYAGVMNAGQGKDIALVRLDTPVTNVTPAVRYAGPSLIGSTATIVGYGWTGTGLTGDSIHTQDRRAGNNVLDVLGGGSGASGLSSNYILADFDNPNNASNNRFGGSSTPLPLEYMLAFLDSGGGMFVDVNGSTRLAGINDFIGGSDGINSNYGDFMGFMRVSVANDWIDDNMAAQWINAAGGSAQTLGNWQIGNTTALMPDSTDILGFNIAGTYTVTFSGANAYSKILARQGTVTLDLGGATQTVSSPMQNGSVTVGRDATDTAASLTVTNGTLTSTDAFIGRSGGSNGTLIVTGAGTQWNLSESLYLAGSSTASGGTAALMVNAGAAVHVADTLKLWSTNATLNLNGGAVTANRLDFNGGSITGASGGSLTLNSAGCVWTAGTISTGGVVNVSSGAGLAISGAGGKTMDGGTLNSAGSITWSGVMIIGRNGATVNNLAGGVFDLQSNSTLAYTSGTLPTFNNAGTFRKSAGSGTSNIAWTFSNTGTVEIQNGTLQFNAGYSQTAGRLLLSGGTFSSGAAVVLAGGSVEGSGTINANLQTAGSISPGAAAGQIAQLTFNQNLVLQSGASLSMELGGTSPGVTYDLLNVAGSFQAGGVLQVKFSGGFESLVGAGDVFTIVNGASSVAGAFTNAADNARVLTADGLGSFVVHYGATSSFAPDDVVLTNFLAYIPGDFNLDGIVDGADFAAWLNGFGTQSGASVGMGDADHDGDVDGADFVAWQTHYGGPASQPNVSAVPEPASWLLLAISLTGAGLVSRRRHA